MNERQSQVPARISVRPAANSRRLRQSSTAGPAEAPSPRRPRFVLILLACDLLLGLLALHLRAELRQGRRQIARLEEALETVAPPHAVFRLAVATERHGETLCAGPAAISDFEPRRNRRPVAASNRGNSEAGATIQKGDHG